MEEQPGDEFRVTGTQTLVIEQIKVTLQKMWYGSSKTDSSALLQDKEKMGMGKGRVTKE